MTDLDQLTSTVSLQRLAEIKGVQLRKRGHVFHGRCPFHDSKSDTLSIDPKSNTWSCTGRCRAKNADLIAWVMKSEAVSRKHAIELVRSDFTTAPDSKPSKAKKANNNKMPAFVSGTEPDAAVLDRVVGYYHETLKQSPEALAYLKDRGLTHSGMIDAFRIGYANRSIGYRLPATNRRAGFELRGQLIRIGIYRKSGHEHFAGSLVVPFVDEHGLIEEVYGRKVSKRLRAGTPLHTWLHDKPTGVFNVHAVTSSQEIVVTDSVINALTFWVNDVRNVTVAIHADHFMERLLPAFKSHGTKRVYLGLRRTNEADVQADSFGNALAAQGIEVFRVVFPQGMDSNDFIRARENPRDALHQAVRSAVWLAGKPRPTIVPATITDTRDSGVDNDSKPTEVEPAVHEDEVVLHYGDRRWRVRGLMKNLSFEVMRVNLLVSRENGSPMGHRFHVDSLELYSHRQRQAFIKQASDELGLDEQTLKHDIGRVLLELEARQDKMIRAELEPKAKTPEMSPEDREDALRLLRDPKVTDRILADFERIGFIGENTNKLTAYLAVTSRKLKEPLAIVVQSSSAAGKSSLMDAVLSFVPEEDPSAAA